MRSAEVKTTMNNSEHKGPPAAVPHCTLRWSLCGKWTDPLLFIAARSAARACEKIKMQHVRLASLTSKANLKEISEILCL